MYIKSFERISKGDIGEVGGKGASLGEMTQVGLPIPPGFVVTVSAYQGFASRKLSDEVKKEILQAFDDLGAERVAVRSSAVAEDSSASSFAGALESYLNISRDRLIENIYNCWESIKSERVRAYVSERNIPEDKLLVAVVVQKMIESEVSGVTFSVNPITKNAEEIMIEASFGLGEMLVQGLITPDNFLVDKNSSEIKERNIDTQETMLIFQDGENKEVPVPREQKDQPALTDEQIQELAKMAVMIEDHYRCPQDIEWTIDEKGKVWILQSRPVTTL